MKKIKLSRKRSGFTLLEAIITIGIMGIAAVTLGQYLKDGLYAWNMGSVSLAMNAEARSVMAAFTKFVHNVQGSTVAISRLNSNAPANSLISGKVAETVYLYTNTPGSCGMGTSAQTIASPGQDVDIFQDGRSLVAKIPVLPPGADLNDPASVAVSYKYLTLSANLDNVMFSYTDTVDERTIYISARFSKVGLPGRPPVEIMLKKAVSVKTQYSAGYYGE